MMIPLTPHNELSRLKTLYDLHILDTPAEERFDRITRLAQQLFSVPIAVISLVDDTRQWFKSCQGLQASETSRDISFCAHAIHSSEIFYIVDALEDPRFADNPVVIGPPYVRFYAGAPLISSDSFALGTLCIIDIRPRVFNESELRSLRDLADIVQEEINQSKFNQAIATIRDYEISLQKESARYEDLLNHLSEVVFQTDRNDCWVFLNPAWKKITNYAVAESIGMSALASVHYDDKNRVMNFFDALRHGEMEDGHCDARWLTKENNYRWFSMFAKQVTTTTKDVVISGTLTDIHEEKRRWEYSLNNQLRLEVVNAVSTGLLRCNTASSSIDYTLTQLAKRIPDAKCIYASVDSNGILRLPNHSGQQTFLANISIDLNAHPPALSELKNGQLIRYDSGSSSASLNIFKSINPPISAALIVPIHEYNGSIKLLVVLTTQPIIWSHEIELLIEISYLLSATLKRVLAEEKQALAIHELIEASSQLNSFIANHRYGVLIENANKKVVIVNNSLAQQFSFLFEKNDFIGCDSYKIWQVAKLRFDDPEKYLNTINAQTESRSPVFDYIVETRDGIVFEYDYIPVWSKDVFLGGIWQYRDITERKKIERMKNEFISMVSHELRTPLTSIRGSLGLLGGGIAGPLSDQAQSLVTIANKNTDRLLHLINDILDVEKIEAGKLDFKFRQVLLMPLLQQAVDINQAYAKLNNVEICIQHENADRAIITDPDRLLQVLANLLSNAAKFSPANAKVQLVAQGDDKEINISIHDQGPGIAPEFHDRIFQKFAQADSSDSRNKNGTGLGLNIAKSITERLGGHIGFSSESGNTVFYIKLPLQPL